MTFFFLENTALSVRPDFHLHSQLQVLIEKASACPTPACHESLLLPTGKRINIPCWWGCLSFTYRSQALHLNVNISRWNARIEEDNPNLVHMHPCSAFRKENRRTHTPIRALLYWAPLCWLRNTAPQQSHSRAICPHKTLPNSGLSNLWGASSPLPFNSQARGMWVINDYLRWGTKGRPKEKSFQIKSCVQFNIGGHKQEQICLSRCGQCTFDPILYLVLRMQYFSSFSEHAGDKSQDKNKYFCLLWLHINHSWNPNAGGGFRGILVGIFAWRSSKF